MLQDKLWIYDQMGEVSPDRILGVVYYAAEKFGVQQIILDSLMKIVTDESGNDAHNAQKKFVNQLCAAAQELNIHVHLVHHSRKRDDERQRPTKQDAKGSGAIVDQCDNFISVFKIPRKDGVEDEGPTHCLYVDKARHQEWEGTIALWLHDGSLQFMEAERARAKEYVR
jgi:twinkle protein